MDMDLYNLLHGDGIKPRKIKPVDDELEKDIKKYVEIVIEEEKNDFQEGIESYAVHANKRRQQIHDAILEFYQTYAKGYRAISEASQDLQKPEITEESQKVLSNSKEFVEALVAGKPLYELLGYTYENLIEFYNVLNTLFERQEYEKVRDGFYFLITISPLSYEFWTGLGIAATKLQRNEEAELALYQSLELNPRLNETYKALLYLYFTIDRFNDAEVLIEKSMAYAQDNLTYSWAQELEQTLNKAKDEIQERR